MGSTTDKVKGATNEAIGKAKQGIGEATGSDRLQGSAVQHQYAAHAGDKQSLVDGIVIGVIPASLTPDWLAAGDLEVETRLLSLGREAPGRARTAHHDQSDRAYSQRPSAAP